MSDKTWTPIEQKEIDFYDDPVIAVRMDDGKVYVPVRPICELVGVARRAQQARIERDPILSEAAQLITVGGSGIVTIPQGREMLCLPLDYLNGWLFGINANRVKPEIRDALLRYQRECYQVLFQAFGKDELTARPDENLMQSASPSAAAYRNALAIAKMARQQFYLEQRVDGHDAQLALLQERIALLEANMGDTAAFVTQREAQQISSAVKTIALGLATKHGGNHFGRVYNELYKRYAITEYKRLPAVKFEEAMTWLRGWWVDVSDDSDVPF